jgi:hypothetical protein
MRRNEFSTVLAGAVLALTLVVLLAGPVAGQVLTGNLVGVVKDETGGVLPGASVHVTSPKLIGGPVTMATDEKGQFRLPELAPGEYTLEIELEKFATYHEAGIQIGIESNVERTVILKVAGIAESVSVEGAGSVVDASRSGLAYYYRPELLTSIPVRRYSMFDFIKAAPGVSPTSPTSGIDNSVSVLGSGGNENLYLLDGTNFTCPCSGGAVPQPDVDIIQEVHIDSVGAPAEYGNIQGAVFNIVTKQGGNEFTGDASYYGQSNGLTSHPVHLPCVGCSQSITEYTRAEYRDATAHLGGPIVHDRLWFFGGYQYLRDYDSQPGTDPRFPRISEYDKMFVKGTWQITSRLKLVSSMHDEFWVNPDRPTLSRPFLTTARTSGSRPTTTLADLTHILSANTLWEARMSRFKAPQTSDPPTGDFTTPYHIDLANGISSGGVPQVGGLTLTRNTFAASLSHHHNLLGAGHELKFGTQIEEGDHFGWSALPSGVNYTDNKGQPFQATFRQPSTSGGKFYDAGVFASDTLRVGSRVTVNLGVRFDHDRAISQDLLARDGFGNPTGGTIPGLGTLYTWNVVSPRLGLTVKLTSDNRTLLRASYGRFHQGILTGELAPVDRGIAPTTTAAFDPATGQYSRIISVVDTTINVRIDPQTKSPRTDQIGVGLERELASRLALSISYVRKNGSDFIGWTDTGGIYRADTRTLPDGRTFPVFALVNSTAERRFLLTNPSDYFLRYNGMLVTMEKRWSNHWQALASYTLSKTEGLQATSASAAGTGQFSSTFGANPFGRDPNSLTNAVGELPNDRTHELRVMGSVAIPRTGILLSTNLQYFTGLPWAAAAQIGTALIPPPLPQGAQRVLLETPGTRRLSSQTLLDLRVSRGFSVGDVGRVELLLDVLNALNNRAEERLADDNLFSPNFMRPSAFIDPRRAMLGVRFTFDRVQNGKTGLLR